MAGRGIVTVMKREVRTSNAEREKRVTQRDNPTGRERRMTQAGMRGTVRSLVRGTERRHEMRSREKGGRVGEKRSRGIVVGKRQGAVNGQRGTERKGG